MKIIVRGFLRENLPLEGISIFLWLCYPAIILTSLSAGQAVGALLALLWFMLPKERRNKAWPEGLGVPAGFFYLWTLTAAILAGSNMGDISDIAAKWTYILLLALAYAQAISGRLALRMILILIAVALLQYPYYVWSYCCSGYAHARALSGGAPNLGSNLMMLLTVMLVLFYSARNWLRAGLGAAGLLLFAALILTLNRSAVLGFLFGYAWISARKAPRILILTLVLAAGVLAAWPETFLAKRFRSVISFRESRSAMIRLHMWEGGMQMLRDRPLLGFTGRSRFMQSYWANYRHPFVDERHSHVHNSLLQTAILHGVPGLGLLIWFFAALWRKTVRHLPRIPGKQDPFLAPLARSLPALLVAVAVNAQFDFVIAEGQRAMFFYSFTGLLLGCALGTDAGPKASQGGARQASRP